jgi:hypothetical protein
LRCAPVGIASNSSPVILDTAYLWRTCPMWSYGAACCFPAHSTPAAGCSDRLSRPGTHRRAYGGPATGVGRADKVRPRVCCCHRHWIFRCREPAQNLQHVPLQALGGPEFSSVSIWSWCPPRLQRVTRPQPRATGRRLRKPRSARRSACRTTEFKESTSGSHLRKLRPTAAREIRPNITTMREGTSCVFSWERVESRSASPYGSCEGAHV